MPNQTKTGGQVLVDHLIANGIDRVFSVPGESFLGAMDAFYERGNEIQFVNCRQEGGAAFMAAAYGGMTGNPGICFVTRGPGATNASIGVHVAKQDSVPMILFVGQVSVSSTGRDAFQEIDIPAMFKPLAKWAVQIDEAERLPELLARAFKVATSGRPGPVVISLPEDVQRELIEAPERVINVPIVPSPSPAQIDQLGELISKAKQPAILLGASTWTAEACDQMADFAQRHDIPVVASFRCQDKIDNDHPNYVGVLGVGTPPFISKLIDDADLLIVLGVELSEIVTEGFTKFSHPKMSQGLVHVHPDEEELGRIYQADLAIHSGMAAFASLVAERTFDIKVGHALKTTDLREKFEEFTTPTTCPGEVHIGEILAWLDTRLPADSFLSCGAGNYTHWVLRFLKHRKFGTQLAPLGAVMGYGVPAAIAASLQYPDRMAVAFAGDGCFLMNAQDLATAKKYGASPIFIVINNGIYGSIRMHQERAFPTRSIGTDLDNPDFVAFAEAFGVNGFRVTKTAEFENIFEEAVAKPGPCLIELVVSEEAISPAFTLSELIERSLKAQAEK
ncbi:MAG: thiamine pyrophosphate-binding protein [Rhodospirillaceae bacterium]|jgi:acetolactate synthase I/II/III large subunit|nr:thiamine pyrophosphate-binding protein [Rhodospirillaceae bacterium]MBT7266927.1 thiamine pyrophosphate-binding protein [Rhodospirillaceae bacterium]